MLRKYGNVLITLFICSDIFLIFLVWVFSYITIEYFTAGRIELAEGFLQHIRIFTILIPVFLLSAQKFDFYAPRRFSNYFYELTKVLKTLSSAVVVFFFLGYITRILQYNYIFILVFWGLSAVSISAYHVLVNFILKHFRMKGFNLRKILIVGSGELAKKSALKFLEHHEFGLNVIGFLSNNKNEAVTNNFGIPFLGKYEELNNVILERSPDIVFFALPPNEERLTRFLVEKIDNEPIDIKIALDINGAFLLKNSVSEIDGIPIISLRERHLAGFQEIIKRIFDFIFALIIIFLATPFSVLVAILIKISSPGPVFYIQERASLDGKKFRLIKFRTMKENAETKAGPVWAAKNDSRRTKVGVWLRRTGFDELPQFLNVLKGQMSIVGPRPERPEFIEEFRILHPHYMLRHAVKTGITGWAQVHGLRGNTSLEKRLEYDFDYINNFTFLFDLKIMLMTIPAIFKGRGAY